MPIVDFGVDFNVTALATGDGHLMHHCALSVTAAMRCWGWNVLGQLGMGDTADRLSPVTPLIQVALEPTLEPTRFPSSEPTFELPSGEPTSDPSTDTETDAADRLHAGLIGGAVALIAFL